MAGSDSKPPASGTLDLYARGDAIPVPEAKETSGDSAWALFSEISRQHDNRFADTAPASVGASLSASEAAGWAKTRPLSNSVSGALRGARRAEQQPLFSLESAMLVARRNNRVCPRPERWVQFFALLPPRKTLRGSQMPPPPVTGQAWSVTPPLTKRLCFREQVEWANREGVLESAMAFMQALPEEDWLHMGED
ncbi:hypothetical protein [Ramlibacter sp.]|jgi:hypothetical protein|uniref:hypothetical protein n=1 Tax=Ramlibacter sp. TaxID=1917967 RepID=UPI002635697A|nr:hypothetical protein [Ramlibacter sp.]